MTDLVDNILAGYAYHLNVMPLDCQMPDPGSLVRAIDIPVPAPADGTPRRSHRVFDDGTVRVTTVPVTHGHAHPALAYRFDTADGVMVFSGDTTVNDDLIALARDADILVHQVADLDYLERHGLTGPDLERMAGLQTDVNEVGSVAERADVRELILSHYLPAEPEAISDAEWAERAGKRLQRENDRRPATGCGESVATEEKPRRKDLDFPQAGGKVKRNAHQLFGRHHDEGSARRPSRRRCRHPWVVSASSPRRDQRTEATWAANR